MRYLDTYFCSQITDILAKFVVLAAGLVCCPAERDAVHFFLLQASRDIAEGTAADFLVAAWR